MAVVGIQATSIDMRAAADKSYKKQNLYDIQIKSSAGFEGGDISALKSAAGVHTVMPTYVYDVYIYSENESRTLRTYALPGELNNVELLDGRLPQNDKECAVESELLQYGGYKIGDTVTLGLDNMDDYYNIFDNDEFTVVGVVSSPFFISFERGNTSLGDGRLNFYLYLFPEAYNLDVYTDVYISMDSSRDMDNLTDDYYERADEWKKQIQQIGDIRVQAKKDDFIYAQKMLYGAPVPEWFYFTRKDGVAYDSYYQDTFRLQKIGYVFPLIFFLVALLVSLTTMSRMVEEHRTQIGIYKALGYNAFKIITKYLIYAFTASGIGGILGVIVGSRVFPLILSDTYGHLYDMPPVETPIPLGIGFFAVLSSVGVVLLVTVLTCVNSMSDTPANLMRPKAPPSGKRVLIERIPLLWNRFNFFAKVTARNIFRYKRRFVMTLIGVAGCSALLLTAFGLRDSVGGVGTLQYEKVAEYTSRAYLKDITSTSQRGVLDTDLSSLPGEYLYIREESVDAENKGSGLSASLFVVETPEKLNGFINLRSRKSGEIVPLTPDGVVITEKLARVMGVLPGGSFDMTTSDGRTYTVQITGIAENYVLHFVFMPPNIYTDLFGGEPSFNSILAMPENYRDFAETLLANGGVRAVVNTADIKENINVSTDALKIVTVVLIVLACMLAFVVLFNLTNINITERIRELATIKVLGFYDAELAVYIYRENGVVTTMGIVLGLIGGIYLHGFVLTAAEIDLLMFPHIIEPRSYIFSVVLSVVFAVFVNLVMSRKLVMIDMVESLKNVE